MSSGHSITDEEKNKFSFELQNFHAVSAKELAKFFSTDVMRGVDEQAVAARLAEYGRNVIPPPKELPLWVKFILAFFVGFAPLLWVAAFFVFLSWQVGGAPPPYLCRRPRPTFSCPPPLVAAVWHPAE